MRRLSLTDMSFLLVETRQAPMHVGALAVFSLPKAYRGDFFGDLMAGLASGNQATPPFNQIITRSYGGIGTYRWVTDDKFDLGYHLRHIALPRPGTMAQLNALVAHLHSLQLDRSRPLWTFHVIEGLENDRFALYWKTHHALVDGATGAKLFFSTFSPTAEERRIRPIWQATVDRWLKTPQTDAARRRIEDAPAAIAGSIKTKLELLRHAGKIGILSKLLGDDTIPFVSSAPKTPFNRTISAQRRFESCVLPFDPMRTLAKRTDATLNDVVLAICSGALRHYLEAHSDLPGAPLLAMVPVALPDKTDGFSANRVTAINCNLGTNIDHPLKRLAKVKASMNKNKEMLAPLSGAAMESVALINQGILPFANANRRLSNYVRQSANLTISNVPGPRDLFFLNGARLEAIFPLSIIIHGQALNITVTSYADAVCFGLLGCRERIPDLDRIAVHIRQAFEELQTAVTAAQDGVAAAFLAPSGSPPSSS